MLIDGSEEASGELLTADFSPPLQPPEMIPDPEDTKPQDWVDDAMIPDPEATKPEDWNEDAPLMIEDEDAVKPEGWLDDAPDMIPDPAAVMPEDWEEEADGVWESPLIGTSCCICGVDGCNIGLN